MMLEKKDVRNCILISISFKIEAAFNNKDVSLVNSDVSHIVRRRMWNNLNDIIYWNLYHKIR